MSLDREAGELKVKDANWGKWDNEADKIFAENDEIVRHWLNRGSPPAADLRPAKFPLAFLLWRFENEPDPPVVNRGTRREWIYLKAIAECQDARRIQVLDELYQNTEHDSNDSSWNWIISEGASPDWASRKVAELVSANHKFNEYCLLYSLLYRFGPYLPGNLKQPAYDLVRLAWEEQSGNQEHTDYLDLLLRIDLVRARRDLIEMYSSHRDRFGFHVATALDKYKGPSVEVVKAVQNWQKSLSDRERDIFGKHLENIERYSDLLRGPTTTLNRIKALRSVDYLAQWNKDELSILVRALVKIESPEATKELAAIATDDRIDVLARIDVMGRLARTHSADLPKTLDWWAHNEGIEREWLRSEANKGWDDSGKHHLQESFK